MPGCGFGSRLGVGLEGSVFSSAAWKRRFSRRRSSPGASLAAAAATASPLHSLTHATALPSSSESRAAIGAVESLSTRFPLGLPTWEQTTTFAPASVRSRSVGSDSLIRVSSEMVTGPSPLANGVFRSERTRHVTPLRSIREARELTLSLFGMGAFAIVRTRWRARIAPAARSMAMGWECGSAVSRRVRPRAMNEQGALVQRTACVVNSDHTK